MMTGRMNRRPIRCWINTTLDELMAKVTPENLHGEFDFGPTVGNEF
jgi:antitoxin component of MazEF toxin-antitoxin module